MGPWALPRPGAWAEDHAMTPMATPTPTPAPSLVAARGHGFWFTNRVVNPVLRTVLRSPLGRIAGRKLGLLSYAGRRSGRPRSLVVQYLRDRDTVWIVPVDAGRKRWWRNFVTPQRVELRLAGQPVHGDACAYPAAAVRDGLEAYL